MKLLYVDESGDPGLEGYSTPHYILSGMIVDENDWFKYLSRLKSFRKSLRERYGLNQRTEIHASELIRIKNIEEYKKIRKAQRISILKDYCSQIPIIFNRAKVINICITKTYYKSERPIHEYAWSRLVQRFDTFLKRNGNDRGIIISDDTQAKLVSGTMRKMRIYNPIPSHFGEFYNAPIDNVIEDLFERDSKRSYFVQSVDVIAHLLYRKEFPKGSLKKYGLEKQFQKMNEIFLKEASRSDPFGIVRK